MTASRRLHPSSGDRLVQFFSAAIYCLFSRPILLYPFPQVLENLNSVNFFLFQLQFVGITLFMNFVSSYQIYCLIIFASLPSAIFFAVSVFTLLLFTVFLFPLT